MRYDLKRKDAHDRRRAAIHESGHVVVTRHLGIEVYRAGIWRTGASDSGSKIWVGSFEYRGQGVRLRAHRMKSVAGVVAEFIWAGEEIEDLYWYEPEIMSPSDWAGTGCTPGDPSRALLTAVEDTTNLLSRSGPLWPEVVKTARRLIVEARESLAEAA